MMIDDNYPDAVGFLQEYVRGGQSYEQAGTDIPDYGVAQKYEQERGGPLMSRTIQYSPPNAILKSPHMDSPYMDQLIERGFKPLMPPKPAKPKGPQLPSFV